MNAVRDDEIPRRVSDVLGGRPTRWLSDARAVGDFDGRERTLEVFGADADDQRALLRRLRPMRPEIEQALGGPLVVVFHTTDESVRLYPEIELPRRREHDAADSTAARPRTP